MKHYALYAALLLSSCRASRIDPEEQPWPIAPVAAVPVAADGGAPGGKVAGELPTGNQQLATESEALRVAKLPNKVQRRYRRNVKAAKQSAPLFQGRGAVAAANISAPVQTSYKPAGPQVQNTDSGTVQVATGAKGAQVAVGEGNVLKKVEPVKPTLWQRVTGLFTGLTSTVGLVALAVVALHAFGPGVGYGMGWARRLVA